MYRAGFALAMARKVHRLDHPVCTRLLGVTELFVHSPRPDGIKKLTSTENTWRIRVGDYWIIYSVEDNVLVVIVVRVVCRHEICHSQHHLPPGSWIGGHGTFVVLIGASGLV